MAKVENVTRRIRRRMMFAIQHKASGQFLPPGKGFTWWEGEVIPRHTPRLFVNKRAAQSFQVNWTKGRAILKYVEISTSWGDDGRQELTYEDRGRTRDMLLIIPVTLTFGEPL